MLKLLSNTIMADEYWDKGGLWGLIVRGTLRSLQFVIAIIAAALYGVDLSTATHNSAHANSAWVYAELVAGLSLLTCIIRCILSVRKVAWTAWDWVLFVLWAAQAGVFGTMYVSGHTDLNDGFTTSPQRMKAAVSIDLVNMLLWFATAVHGAAWCISNRRMTRLAKTPEFESGLEDQMSSLAPEEQNNSEGLAGKAKPKSKETDASGQLTYRPEDMVKMSGARSEQGSNEAPPKYSP